MALKLSSVQKMGDAFTSMVQQWQNQQFQQQQFDQEIGFRNRQLRLNEGFRRDELQETIRYHTTVGSYYEGLLEQGEENARIKIEQGKSIMLREGWIPTDETVQDSEASTFEAYGQSWIAPPEEPTEQARFVPGAFGTQIEEKFIVDPVTREETITNYETVISPPTVNKGSGLYSDVDISNEVGSLNKLLALYDEDPEQIDNRVYWDDATQTEIKLDYKIWKALASEKMNDMMTKTGVPMQGDIVTFLRSKAGITEGMTNQQKEATLLKVVDAARYYGVPTRNGLQKINDQQYEALRYWALTGTK